MSTIKNYVWVFLIVGVICIPSAAQTRPTTARATGQRMSVSQRAAALNTSLQTTCAAKAPQAAQVLSHDARVFANDRVANTINGVWIGRVAGEFDPSLKAKDGFLNVDYYMIVDVKRGEAFVYEEVTDKRSGGPLRPKRGAPTWSYVWCARENYKNASPRQVHEFVKVSDDVQDARQVLNNSLGTRYTGNQEVVLSQVWDRLVESKFFDDPKRSLAYAGVLFKPLTLGTVESVGGGSLLELRMVGEYRGSGQTAAKFVPGNPIHNVEQGHFLGLSLSAPEFRQVQKLGRLTAETEAGSGDYLSASYELGNEMMGPKSDAEVAVFSTQMAFDKVVIGPLAPTGTASARKPKK